MIYTRFKLFSELFVELQLTNSRNEKELILDIFKTKHPDLQDDLNYIFETLAGKHPIGWKFIPASRGEIGLEFNTIKECIQACENLTPKTLDNTFALERKIGIAGKLLSQIVNRELRLGIGNSQLKKNALTPMLARKYEGGVLNDDVAITEKLDGNRCIAHHDGDSWQFTSRSGKTMNVNFDMSGLPTCYIYDGEVMSKKQTELSIARCNAIRNNELVEGNITEAQILFNETSGLVNRHGVKTGLIYNIFDIIDAELPYCKRRFLLQSPNYEHSKDIRILPVLYSGQDIDIIMHLLDRIVAMGGEGIMLNYWQRKYERKRSDALLKYKQVQTIDMKVIDIEGGKGKYKGVAGALVCLIETSDGKIISCNVGSGLSDEQREEFADCPENILHRIVEVGYHELTQEKRFIGTNIYSLRFPRLLRIRYDKDDTSEF